jgi:T1SS-143 domain-containing protein
MALSVNLDQWADGPAPDADGTGGNQEEFVNGNLNPSKAHYNEGDSIPYRAVIDDLTNGTTYSLLIQWDTVDSGAYALDYLTGFNFSFDGTRHPGEPDVTPTVGVTGLSSGAISTVAIPSDPQLLDGFGAQFGVTDGLDSGQPSGEQFITIFGAVTNLSTSNIIYTDNNTKASISVSFTYIGSNANNADSVVVAWGGHIASSLDWRDDPGETVETASDISGSPYHTRVLTIFENGVPKSVGNQDRSLSAAAVFAPPVADDVSLLADEDNIAGGNNDVQAGDDDQSGLTGTLPVTDAISVNFADLHLDPVLDTSGAAVTSSGTALTFFWDGASRTLFASKDTSSLAMAQATAAFKIEVAASSPFTYTFTLLDQVDHPDPVDANTEDPNILIDLTYTAVGAGTDTGVVHVTIDDDIPIASQASDSGTVDEDGVPGGIAGGDGDVAGEATVATGSVAPLFNPGADQPLTFSLNTNTSGLPVLTSGGVTVTYAVVGNLLTASAGLNTVFTFALDGITGAWTFTLVDQLDHPTLNGLPGDDTENDLAINLSSILRATDFDGDTVAAAANALIVTVDDDTPVPLTPAILSVDNTANAFAEAVLGAFGNVGADQPGTSVFVGTNGTILQGTIQDGTPTLENLKSGGSNIFLFGFGTDTLIATTDATNTDVGQRVFTMTLNPDGSVQANDLYDITMLKPIDNLVDVDISGETAAPASGNPLTLVVEDIGNSTIDALFSGFIDRSNNTTTQDTVNVSGAGVGVGNGQDFDFDPQTASATDNLTDRMRIDFLEDDGDGVLETGEAVTVNRFTFEMNQNNSPGDDGDALIRVYDEAGNEVQITGIIINGQTLVGAGGAPVPSHDPNPGGNVTATASGLGYELHGLGGGTSGSTADNDFVTVITTGGYSRIDISGIGNDANKDTFDILLESVAIPTPFEIVFNTQANLTDADGDTTTPSQLEVHLLA